MDRIRFFFKILFLTFFIAGVGLVLFVSKDKLGKFTPSVKMPTDVLGTSTKRAQEVTMEIASDVGDGIEIAKKQALNIKIGDIVATVARLQKIPQDAHILQEYIKEQAGNVLKRK